MILFILSVALLICLFGLGRLRGIFMLPIGMGVCFLSLAVFWYGPAHVEISAFGLGLGCFILLVSGVPWVGHCASAASLIWTLLFPKFTVLVCWLAGIAAPFIALMTLIDKCLQPFVGPVVGSLGIESSMFQWIIVKVPGLIAVAVPLLLYKYMAYGYGKATSTLTGERV